jgi:tetratricopeptide (TPR) repeat protein
MDDYSVIVNNPDVRSIENFFANNLPGRPLREITYLLDYALFGLDPWGYHFQNIFWHGLNCWLVYLLAVRLDLSYFVAWISSLLFLLHPIHVEVVANSSHRKDSLALAFLLMALLSYMKISELHSFAQRCCWLLASLALWVTAFFAKGNSILFPVVVIAYEYILVPEEKRFIARWKMMPTLISTSSVIALVAWYFYITSLPSFKMAIMGVFIKTENLSSFSTSAYVLMILKSYAFMVSKLLIPLNLSMEYIFPAPTSIADPWVLAALVLLSACFVLAYRWREKCPEMFFLLAVGVILWLPTANVFWPFSYFAADRYLYAPSASLCILAVLASEKIFSTGRRCYVASWMSILCICAFLSWKQTAVWHDEMKLYSQMLKVSPRSLEAMLGLASAHYTAKNYDMASRYARRAIERDYTDYRPYMMLGNINIINNKQKEALELLLVSQQKNPLAPEVYNVLGSLYDDMGKPELAVGAFNTALKLRPDFFEAYTNLGVTLERTGNLSEAESALNRALAANINFVPAWFNLGIVRYKKHDKTGARLAFAEVIKRDSFHVDALNNLATVCRETGDNVCYNETLSRLKRVAPNAAKKLSEDEQ